MFLKADWLRPKSVGICDFHCWSTCQLRIFHLMAAALFYGLLHAFKLKILMETGNTAIFTALLLFKITFFSGFEEEEWVFFIDFSFFVANEIVLLSILGWEV